MKRYSYIKDINNNKLYSEDTVIYKVRRCSASYSTYGLKINKHHGDYMVKGKIEFRSGCFYIRANTKQVNKLKEPKGKEKLRQAVLNDIKALDNKIIEPLQITKVIHRNKGKKLNRFEILDL